MSEYEQAARDAFTALKSEQANPARMAQRRSNLLRWYRDAKAKAEAHD